MIIYTCPECGADLQSFILTSNPPKTQYSCPMCNWSYTEPQGQPEEIIRIPYGGNGLFESTYDVYDLSDACEHCPNDPRNGGPGNCNCILGQPKITC